MRTNPFTIVSVIAALLMPAVCASQNDTYWNASSQTPFSTPTGASYSFSMITQNDNNGTTNFISTTSPSTGYTFTLNAANTTASGSDNFALSAKPGPLNTAAGGSTYIETIITPSAGYAVNISNINFASRSTATGPAAYSVQRVTGSSTVQLAAGTLTTNSVWQYKNNPVSVAGATDEVVTLRIYGYSGTGSSGTANWRLDDIVITASAIILPVTFEKVQAILSGGQLKVQWTTSFETNNDHFDVEVSKNGKDFVKIATLQSKAIQGNSTIPLQYEYTTTAGKVAAGAFALLFAVLIPGFKNRRIIHFAWLSIIMTISISSCQKENLSEVNTESRIFVRIAQVDIDGTKSYSKTVQAIQD